MVTEEGSEIGQYGPPSPFEYFTASKGSLPQESYGYDFVLIMVKINIEGFKFS